jgi:hypothetical protein
VNNLRIRTNMFFWFFRHAGPTRTAAYPDKRRANLGIGGRNRRPPADVSCKMFNFNTLEMLKNRLQTAARILICCIRRNRSLTCIKTVESVCYNSATVGGE